MIAKLFRPQVLLPAVALPGTAMLLLFGGSLGVLSWEQVFFWLAVAVFVAALGLVVVWLLRRQQAQGLSEELMRRQERNLATASPDRKANLQPITDEFRRNIDFLRKLKKKNGIPAVYYLPWYMIIGAPASGKSVLLKGSGFRFCVNDTPLKEGGTLHCDWWFTNQGIFLDTAGRLTVHEGGAADRTEWEQLLKLLRRFRRKRPIDGIMVTVAANDLLEKSERDLQAYARIVRERIDRVTEALKLRVPIFVLVTKCDLVEGFKEYFDALPEGALGQIVGWTNETLTYEGEEQVAETLGALAERLADLRPAFLEAASSREQRRRMFPFPEEFDNVREPLSAFVDALFRADMYTRAPALAGVYITSGTQEGTTVSLYFRRLGEQLGLAAETLGRTFGPDEQRRPYFVKDLFWRVIAPAVGLAVPVDSDKDARRRLVLGIASVAGAVVLGILASVSFARNQSYLRAYPERLVQKLDETDAIDRDRVAESLRENLQEFGEAADLVEELYRHPILHGWGLNKRGRLRADARELFRAHFDKKLWSEFGPLLTSGLEADAGLNLSCAERTSLLLGYLGFVGTDPGDRPPAAAARRLLDLLLEDPTAADQENLAKAWAVYQPASPAGESAPDLSGPARAVAEACAEEASPVTALQKIQNDCWPAVGDNCFARLAAIARVTPEALEGRRKNFEELARQVSRQVDDDTRELLKEVVDELKRAGGRAKGGSLLDRLKGEDAASAAGPGCVETYFRAAAPELQELVKQAKGYQASMSKQRQLGSVGQARVVEVTAAKTFGDIETSLRSGTEMINAACEDADVRAAALIGIARSHVLGTAGRGRRQVMASGYTRSEWEAACGRLGSQKQDLILGGASPSVQQRGTAAIDREARAYSEAFETHWRRELARPESSPEVTAEGLSGAAEALKQEVARVAGEVQDLQCPTVPALERGPRRIAELLAGLSTALATYEQSAHRAAAWIREHAGPEKRAEAINQTMQRQGPVAELCGYIESLPEPELAHVLRAPVVEQWNRSMAGGVRANQRTAWQQHLLGISELTRRFPFAPGGDSHASLQATQGWLEPKSGRLVQLYYQLAPGSGEGDGTPCGLRAGGNIGPRSLSLLKRAKSASDAIFAGVEEDKPVQGLTFTFSGVEFEDAEAGERYGVKVTQVQLALAGQRLAYIMDQPAPRALQVPLPAAGPVNSYVEVSVLGEKRRADVRPARLERGGEWSPLALLRQAERELLPKGVRLTWKVPYGSGPPFILVSFTGDESVRRLLETDFVLEPTDTPER